MTTATETEEVIDSRGLVIKALALSDLKEASYNPRQYFDEKKLKSLVESVKARGILNPLLVRPIGDKYEIMAGARRYRAAKAAGLKDVPAIVRVLTDTAALEVAVIDNLQRADVHPLEEAEGFAALLKQEGYDVARIAAKTGMSASHVYQRLKLADLVEPLKKAFAGGEIFDGHAILLARLAPDDQLEVMKHGLFYEPWQGPKQLQTVKGLANHIATKVHRNLDAAPWKKDDAELLPKAGPCTTCPFRAGNQPELFSDVDRKDKVCTKPACYDEKLEAFGRRKFEDLKEQDVKAVMLSNEYSRTASVRGNALVRSRYHELTVKQKDCSATRQGVFIDGDKIGKTARICAAGRECKVHGTRDHGGSYASSSDSPQQKAARAKERAAEKKRKGEMAARRRIVQAVFDRAKSMTAHDLRIVARRFYHDVWHERRKFLAELLGVTGSTGVGGSAVDKAIAVLDEKKLEAFILCCAISEDIHVSQYGGNASRGTLAAVAARHGVDLKKLAKEPAQEIAKEPKGR